MEKQQFEQLLIQTGIDYSGLSECELSEVMKEVEGEISLSSRPFGLLNTIHSSEANARGVTLEFYLVESALMKTLKQKKLDEDMCALKSEYASFIADGLEEAKTQRARKKLVDSMKESLSLSVYCKPNKTSINKLFTWTTSKTFGQRKASVVEDIIDTYNYSKENVSFLYDEHYSSGAVAERGSLRGASALDVKSAMGVTMLYISGGEIFRLESDADQVAEQLNAFVFNDKLHKTLLEYETKFNEINIDIVDF